MATVRVLSWTAGCRSRARVGGARDQTGAGAFFCYGGFHRALQASALECREAVIEWAAFAYQAVSEPARVRSTPRSNATATFGCSCWVSETGANASCHVLQQVVSPEERAAPASVALCPAQNGFLSVLQLRRKVIQAAWVVHSSAVQKLRTDPVIDVLSKTGRPHASQPQKKHLMPELAFAAHLRRRRRAHTQALRNAGASAAQHTHTKKH